MHKLLPALLLICSTASGVVAASPESDYMIHCMGCHLADGSGMPPDIPAFDEQLLFIAATDRGRAYLVQVPGASQAPLSDEELAAVFNWIMEKYAGPGFRRFESEEITRYRDETMMNPTAVRKDLVAE